MNILFLIMTYFFGSIPTGYLFFKLAEKKDIRLYGSRSTGATNVLRLKGWTYALPVLILDLVKGVLPVVLARFLFEDSRIAWVSALMAVLGHCFPVYIRFKGGKGVATAMGAFAILNFKSFLFALAVFLLLVGLTRFVSLGSIIGILSFSLFLLLFGEPAGHIIPASLLILVVVFRHSPNIKRLIRKEEPRFGQRIEV